MMGSKRIKVPDDLRKARDAALDQGWTVEPGRKSHLKWYPPDGGDFIVTASTSGYWRTSRNALATLKRAGLRI